MLKKRKNVSKETALKNACEKNDLVYNGDSSLKEEKIKEVLEYTKTLDNIQGTASSIAIDMSIKALDTLEKIKYIINEKNYSNAQDCDYGNMYSCENALMIEDIEKILKE